MVVVYGVGGTREIKGTVCERSIAAELTDRLSAPGSMTPSVEGDKKGIEANVVFIGLGDSLRDEKALDKDFGEGNLFVKDFDPLGDDDDFDRLEEDIVCDDENFDADFLHSIPQKSTNLPLSSGKMEEQLQLLNENLSVATLEYNIYNWLIHSTAPSLTPAPDVPIVIIGRINDCDFGHSRGREYEEDKRYDGKLLKKLNINGALFHYLQFLGFSVRHCEHKRHFGIKVYYCYGEILAMTIIQWVSYKHEKS
ncbi:8638_t:CDS:2 [Entrophospora sp. SA101]|nr:8638_t:CDS:2 [Entrophospora sp. SA101]